MKVIKDNIWNYHYSKGYIVIPTNGYVKKNGENVMGRGLALQVKKKYPFFPRLLGQHLRNNGNSVFVYKRSLLRFITFPVKYNWWEKADINLIKQSAIELRYKCKQVYMYMSFNLCQQSIYMPKVGCGNGKLSWKKEVEPIIEKYLPYVTIVDFKS